MEGMTGKRVTLYYLREKGAKGEEKKGNRIKESKGISRPRPGIVRANLDHGHESPHAFLDVSYLTSAT